MDYRFKKILLGYDDSPSSRVALAKALETCKAFHTDLHVVHVKNPKSNGGDYKDQVVAEGNKMNVHVHYLEKFGNVSKEITQTERELGADLIFLGSHGVQGFQPYWIGSNASRVAGASNCPVITVQEDASDASFSKILLPLDDSIESRQKVPYAVVFAKAFNSLVHILAVSKETDQETTRKITAYAHQSEKYLEERGVKYTSDIRQGNSVPEMCIDYAKINQLGLIMMMSETESGGWFMGTYAQTLINHSVIPVMSIHSRDVFLADSPAC